MFHNPDRVIARRSSNSWTPPAPTAPTPGTAGLGAAAPQWRRGFPGGDLPPAPRPAAPPEIGRSSALMAPVTASLAADGSRELRPRQPGRPREPPSLASPQLMPPPTTAPAPGALASSAAGPSQRRSGRGLTTADRGPRNRSEAAPEKVSQQRHRQPVAEQRSGQTGLRQRPGPEARVRKAAGTTLPATATGMATEVAALPPPPPPCAGVAVDPRSELGCARFGWCSGCSLQEGLAAPPLYGEAVELFRGLGLPRLPAVMRAAHGWRCRAKLAVRGPEGRPLIGLFREGSHTVVDIVGPATEPNPPSPPTPTSLLAPGSAAGRTARPPPPGPPPSSSPARSRAAGGSGGLDAARGPLSETDGAAGLSCRAHHPRINEAAAVIKELVVQLRIPPYNEPAPGPSATAPAKARRPSVAATVQSRRARRRCRGGDDGDGGSNSDGTDDPTTAAAAATDGGGLLRYLQLTAVPSVPGGRAEEDPAAAVQVVLVLNADPEDDLRVAPVLELCHELWRVAGLGGPMAPAEDTPQPPQGAVPPLRLAGGGGGVGAAAEAAPLVHSIWLNFQPDARRNTILGEGWRHVAGPAAAWQEFGGVAACVGPGSFVQANYGAMQGVLEEMADMVPYGSRVTELHAGIGVIGLSLAVRRRLAALTCVEINPAAAAPFRASLDLLMARGGAYGNQTGTGGDIGVDAAPVLSTTAMEYVTAEAGSDPERFLRGCDVLVVDPPRRGLGQSLLAALTRQPPLPSLMAHESVDAPLPTSPPGGAAAATALPSSSAAAAEAAPASYVATAAVGGGDGGDGMLLSDAAAATSLSSCSLPSRLVYLSCGFRALRGDLAVLLAGGWRLRSATAHLFFPGTDSLETLVLLTREDGGGTKEGNQQEV